MAFRSIPSPLLAAFAVGLVLSLLAPPAAAEDDEVVESNDDEEQDGVSKAGKKEKHERAPGDEESDDEDDEDFGHMGQFGLRASLVGGLRMVLRYDDSPYCTEPDPLKPPNNQRKFCGHAAPLAVDLGASFALLDFFEPFAWARLGIMPEKQKDTKPVVILGVAARLYMTSASMFKVFIEPAVAYEMESGRGTAAWQANSPEYSQDIVFHLAAGPQLDFEQHVGVFLTGGVTTGVVRAIHNSLDLALGVQGRFP
jgi:hypothetical protein